MHTSSVIFFSGIKIKFIVKLCIFSGLMTKSRSPCTISFSIFSSMWQFLIYHQSSSMFYEVYQLALRLVSTYRMGNSSSRVVNGVSNDA